MFIAELFPNRIRSYAATIATFVPGAANFVVSPIFPYLLTSMRSYSSVI